MKSTSNRVANRFIKISLKVLKLVTPNFIKEEGYTSYISLERRGGQHQLHFTGGGLHQLHFTKEEGYTSYISLERRATPATFH